jgi:hypothetical protein
MLLDLEGQILVAGKPISAVSQKLQNGSPREVWGCQQLGVSRWRIPMF